jgi:uncharacterized protein (TIGR03118 family)
MSQLISTTRRNRFWLATLAMTLWLTACGGNKRYYLLTLDRRDLVTDQLGVAAHDDPHLINPMAMQGGPQGSVWVADNGGGTLTVYGLNGAPLPQAEPRVVTLPVPENLAGVDAARPTGIAYNPGRELPLQFAGGEGSARYLVATEEGTILGYNPTLDPTHAVIAVDNSVSGAVYRGLASATLISGVHLYATNFKAGTVDVFGGDFAPATDLISTAFQDPDLPPGYAPFGIQRLDDRLYVTYALQDDTAREPVAEAGSGFVDAYALDGRWLMRVASGDPLNAPWGLTVSPPSFPHYGRALLVGNHGDGRINVFALADGEPLGTLATPEERPLAIEGLWDFGFAPDVGGSDALLFSAGPNAGQNGVLGNLVTGLVRTQPPAPSAP